jgi:hypothetical protein
MSRQSCEKMTKILGDLLGVLPEFDLALNSLNLSKSLGKKSEAMKIIESFDIYGIIQSVGYKNYKILLERVGSEEELKSRVWKLQIGGKSYDELVVSLKNIGMEVDYLPSEFFNPDYFKTLPKETEIKIIKLSLAELGLGELPSLSQYYQAAKGLGFQSLPAEAVIYQRLADVDQPENNNYSILIEGQNPGSDRSQIFTLWNEDNGPVIYAISVAMAYQVNWRADSDHIFLLPDKRLSNGGE